MTAKEFRNIARALPGAAESSHMNHPDFRAAGKIFATLGYPDKSWGMVKLTPEQQRSFIKQAPDVFHPCNGAWGRNGATNVYLASATKKQLKTTLEAAFGNVTLPVKQKARAAARNKQ